LSTTVDYVDHSWLFYPGKSKDGIPLPDLESTCQELLDSGQLFKGHTKFCNVYDAQNQSSLRTCVLRHVSAHGLNSLVAPTSLQHHKSMHPDDKIIWDDAYNEEYDGLISLPTWEVVSEAEYCHLSKGKCNRVRENIASKFVTILHIEGKVNLADIFTKEMKDTSHFITLRDMFMRPRPTG
jgi:hypothetical protein